MRVREWFGERGIMSLVVCWRCSGASEDILFLHTYVCAFVCMHEYVRVFVFFMTTRCIHVCVFAHAGVNGRYENCLCGVVRVLVAEYLFSLSFFHAHISEQRYQAAWHDGLLGGGECWDSQ